MDSWVNRGVSKIGLIERADGMYGDSVQTVYFGSSSVFINMLIFARLLWFSESYLLPMV